ncbi:MAG: adenylate/guanylate cyclase domain-containing protein [Anaerolineales bacterium]
MSSLPTGTVTLLFTDIEDSTQLWERHPEAMRESLVRHNVILRGAIEAHGGQMFKTLGDAFHNSLEKRIWFMSVFVEPPAICLRFVPCMMASHHAGAVSLPHGVYGFHNKPNISRWRNSSHVLRIS